MQVTKDRSLEVGCLTLVALACVIVAAAFSAAFMVMAKITESNKELSEELSSEVEELELDIVDLNAAVTATNLRLEALENNPVCFSEQEDGTILGCDFHDKAWWRIDVAG